MVKRIIIISIVIFVIITLLTANLHQATDGDDKYGFPLRFYVVFSLECNPCDEKGYNINWIYLLADISICGSIAFGLDKLGQIILKKKSTESENNPQ